MHRAWGTFVVWGCASFGLLSGCPSSTTIVFCEDLDCDDGNPCTTDSCNAANPRCENAALPNGTMCEAGDAPGQCLDLECVPLTCTDLACDTSNPCAIESCDEERVVCLRDPLPDDTPCEIDGELGVCEGGTCRALTCDERFCSDGNPCTADACDTETVECSSTPVADDLVCAVLGAFGVCQNAVCDLSAPVEFGTLHLVVEYLPEPEDPVFYEAVCAATVTFSGRLVRRDDFFEAFIALPEGNCTLSTFVQVGDVRQCEVSVAAEVSPGFAGDLETSSDCP